MRTGRVNLSRLPANLAMIARYKKRPHRPWKEAAMDLGVQGFRVLVTAGAGGIGLEIARSFVRKGAKVHICDVDDAALTSLATSDPDVTRSRADVASRTDVSRLFDEALDALGG